MKVIYHDNSGRHLSVIAAAMHLQTLNDQFAREDLEHLPYFLHTKEPGELLYLGLDAQGNEIYVMGRGRAFPKLRNSIPGINRAFKLNQSFIFADVGPLVNWRLKIFDFINRKDEPRDRMNSLVYRGIERARPGLRQLVAEVQKKTTEGEGSV